MWNVGASVELDGEPGVIVSRFRDLDGVVHFVVETETTLQVCAFGDLVGREPLVGEVAAEAQERVAWTQTSTLGGETKWNYEYGLIRG